MTTILAGIFGLYNAGGSLKTALTGGMHLEVAPPTAAEPYAVYNLISGRPDYMFTEVQELVTIQFDIYALTNASRKTIYDALTALYDDSKPTATGYTSIIMERTNYQFLREGDQNQIFRAIVEYDCMIEKAR